MFEKAAAVLRENDMGGWTRAAPNLYPHQWSWDTAFIAIGLAHLDTGRAATEIRSLFDHQWKNGKVPHIVFNADAPPESYFPGPEHWASAADTLDSPSGPARSRGPRPPRDAAPGARRRGPPPPIPSTLPRAWPGAAASASPRSMPSPSGAFSKLPGA